MSYLTFQQSSDGAILEALIGVSEPRGMALAESGKVTPYPVKVRALIDTGASCSCIDPSIHRKLGLSATGSIFVGTPTTGSRTEEKDQYDVSLMILNPLGHPLIKQTLPVIECDLVEAFRVEVLIGRDILHMCLFSMDGQAGTFTLAY